MAAENPTWGAPRIHGEIQKLGLEVSEHTVSRSMPRRPAHPGERQRWRTFLANHREVIVAVDFFTVSTATFRVLYVFFVVHHARRELMHFRISTHPTAAWITQQLREAFPYDQETRYLILDRDARDDHEVLNARHLQRLLARFAAYYVNDRTHLSLEKDTPAVRVVEPKPHPAAEVIALPRLGGLHHRCAWRRAA